STARTRCRATCFASMTRRVACLERTRYGRATMSCTRRGKSCAKSTAVTALSTIRSLTDGRLSSNYGNYTEGHGVPSGIKSCPKEKAPLTAGLRTKGNPNILAAAIVCVSLVRPFFLTSKEKRPQNWRRGGCVRTGPQLAERIELSLFTLRRSKKCAGSLLLPHHRQADRLVSSDSVHRLVLLRQRFVC